MSKQFRFCKLSPIGKRERLRKAFPKIIKIVLVQNRVKKVWRKLYSEGLNKSVTFFYHSLGIFPTYMALLGTTRLSISRLLKL